MTGGDCRYNAQWTGSLATASCNDAEGAGTGLRHAGVQAKAVQAMTQGSVSWWRSGRRGRAEGGTGGCGSGPASSRRAESTWSKMVDLCVAGVSGSHFHARQVYIVTRRAPEGATCGRHVRLVAADRDFINDNPLAAHTTHILIT